MLDLLPPDILQDIIFFTLPKTRPVPSYVFNHHNSIISELLCVSKLLRQKLLPFHIKNYSLVRRREYKTKLPDRSLIRSILSKIEHYEGYVQSLELHSSQMQFLNIFCGVRSLNIFGSLKDKSMDFSRFKFLSHLSFILPSLPLNGFKFSQIRRLDLFIESDIQGLSLLNLPLLCELNISTTELLSLLTLQPLVKLLKSLNILESLALIRRSSRVQSRNSGAFIHHEHTTIGEFFDALAFIPLKKLTVDSSIIRHSFELCDLHDIIPDRSGYRELEFELIELCFVSLSSIEQRLTTLEFLMRLPFTVNSIKLIYGVQIELPYDTSLKFFTDLFYPLTNEEHGKTNSIERYASLKSVTSIYTLMAWNLTEDQRLEEYQYQGMDIFSYDANSGIFPPNYKKTNKSKMKFSPNSIMLVKDFKYIDEYDYRFWSLETISRDLQRFSGVSKS